MTEPDVGDGDWVVDGLARRKRAQAQLAEVELVLVLVPVLVLVLVHGRYEEAEAAARKSLAGLASSLNWLEDTDEFDEAHRLLDLAGAYVRRPFGCSIHWTGSGYEQRCPVAIAQADRRQPRDRHRRLALHDLRGERGRRARGPMRVLRVAWVTRPDQPDARLQALPLAIEELRAKMPPAWKPGMPLSRDRCLLPCEGVEEFDLAELQELAAEAPADAAREVAW